MKIRHPAVIGFLTVLAAWLVRWWIGTLRCRIVNRDDRPHPSDGRRDHYIYAFWHETLMFHLGAHRTRINVFISEHSDGEAVAQICRRVGYGVIRGSSTRGGVKGLLEMVRSSGLGNFAMTPDGPRGPRRRVQPGLVFLASRTGVPIVPFGVGFTRAWRAKSWDRFAVPLPWSKVVFSIGPALTIPPNLTKAGLERYRVVVEEQMNEMTALAERLAGASAQAASPLAA